MPGSRDVLEPVSQEIVTFENIADARLAKLHFRYGVQVSDELLEILRDPGFSPKDITFQSGADIDVHISKLRYTRALQRAQCRQTTSATIPLDILEHVMTCVETQPGLRRAEMKKILSNLSLVHRSFTLPVQRRLRKIFTVTSSNYLKLLRSWGPNTLGGGTLTISDVSDPKVFKLIIGNVAPKSLTIEFTPLALPFNFFPLIPASSAFSHLRIEMGVNFFLAGGLRELCRTTSGLSNLLELDIVGTDALAWLTGQEEMFEEDQGYVNDHDFFGENALRAHQTPSYSFLEAVSDAVLSLTAKNATMTTLRLLEFCDQSADLFPRDIAPVLWLLGCPSLTTLELDLCFVQTLIEKDREALDDSALASLTLRLTHITIHAHDRYFCDHHLIPDVSFFAFVGRCRNLETLIMDGAVAPFSTRGVQCFPPSLRMLQLSVSALQNETFADVESRAVECLKSMSLPSLVHIVLEIIDPRGSPHPWRQFAAWCTERGIILRTGEQGKKSFAEPGYYVISRSRRIREEEEAFE